MRHLKNTLYVTSPDAYIAREGECLLVVVPDKTPVKFPAHNLESLVHFGYPGCSPASLELCAKMGISVCFLTKNGQFIARVEGPQSGNVLLRKKQYRISDSSVESALLASKFVTAKVINCRNLLLRAMRDHDYCNNPNVENTCKRLKMLIETIEFQDNLDGIRGIEGEAARIYFNTLNHLILKNNEFFFINGRSRRPPLDRFNSLLSYFYTLLVHDCKSACETVGLDPSVGFLHRDRPGRPSLALDIMEELRPVFVDRLCLTIINRQQIKADDFDIMPNNAVLIKDSARKNLIENWQKRKSDIITHPFTQEKIEFGLIPYVQAQMLSRYFRGDLDSYPPFIWK